MHCINILILICFKLQFGFASVLEISHTSKSGTRIGCTTLKGIVQHFFIETNGERRSLDKSFISEAGLEDVLPKDCLQSKQTKQFPESFSIGPLTRCQRGPPGKIGPQGVRGEVGPRGKFGIDGRPGLNGRDGIDAMPGPKGQLGYQGPKGPKGDVGPDGHIGFRGFQGPPGRDGRDSVGINKCKDERPNSAMTSSGLNPSEMFGFNQCEHLTLRNVKRQSALAQSNVNIFICNSNDVYVNVAVNSSISDNYALFKNTNGKQIKIME